MTSRRSTELSGPTRRCTPTAPAWVKRPSCSLPVADGLVRAPRVNAKALVRQPKLANDSR